MQFNNELHKQLFALFIAESNSASYRENRNLFLLEENLIELIFTIDRGYQLLWLDRSYHESFQSEVIRMVKEDK
jgi:hypothetical protein